MPRNAPPQRSSAPDGCSSWGFGREHQRTKFVLTNIRICLLCWLNRPRPFLTFRSVRDEGSSTPQRRALGPKDRMISLFHRHTAILLAGASGARRGICPFQGLLVICKRETRPIVTLTYLLSVLGRETIVASACTLTCVKRFFVSPLCIIRIKCEIRQNVAPVMREEGEGPGACRSNSPRRYTAM